MPSIMKPTRKDKKRLQHLGGKPSKEGLKKQPRQLNTRVRADKK